MYGVLWIFLGLLPCLIVYFVVQQNLKKIQQEQRYLIEKIRVIEQLLQQKITPIDQPVTPPALTRPTVTPHVAAATINTPVDHSPISSSKSSTAADLNSTSHDPVHNALNTQSGLTQASPFSTQKLEPDERSISVTSSVWLTLSGWFSGGNTIVRIGVLVLLIGVVLLLRLLNERIEMPIELWLSFIVMGALGLTGLGLRLRHTRRGYALSLQGTGLAILYLTLFSAYRLYDLLPSQLTFILLAVLASVTALLSLRQDALPLAVLGFGGAFFAPILTSTEQGRVVMLFGYYLLINLAVAWIAHQRTWKILNLLSASATLGVALLWGWRSFDPALRWQMELLLIAHVGLYLFIVVRYSQLLAKQPLLTQHDGSTEPAIVSVDSGLLFAVPLVAFGLQAGLLHDVPYALAISSAALAALYLGLAYWLKQHRLAVPLLREGVLAVGLGFLALILPLALDAQWTSTGWLVQGVALVWVGVRQARVWQVVFGVGLQMVSLLILLWLRLTDAEQTGWLELLIACMAILCSAALLRQPMQAQTAPNRLGSICLLVLGGLLGVWLLQDRWVTMQITSNGLLLNTHAQIIWDLLLLTTLGLLLSMRMWWQELRWLIRWLSLLIGGLLVCSVGLDAAHRLVMLLATVVWLGLQLGVWRHLAQREVQSSQRYDQAIGLSCGLLLLSLWSFEFYPNAAALVLLPIALLLVLALPQSRLRLPDWLMLQRSQHDLYPWIAFGFALWIGWANLVSTGQLWPLPYLPLLNLLDCCLMAVLFWLYQGLQTARVQHTPNQQWSAQLALGGLAFWSLSGVVVRGLHQWLDTPLWPDAWHNDTVQTSLTIVWSVTALLVTVLASRYAWRALWWVGIGLLMVVIAKLLLVDLSNLSAMARVISFIGAGGLMLVIGYVAPLPPEVTADRAPAAPPKQ